MTQVWYLTLVFRNVDGEFRTEETLKILGQHLPMPDVLDIIRDTVEAQRLAGEELWQMELSRRAT